jgi:general secretion pathway protein G
LQAESALFDESIVVDIGPNQFFPNYSFLGIGNRSIHSYTPVSNFFSKSKTMHKKFSLPAQAGARAASRARSRGFTLIEVMVVVVIMGILAALVVPKLMGRADDARIIAAKQDISTLMQGLKLYKLDNQRYPTTEQGLQALIAKPTSGPPANGWKTGGYVDKLPKDPWGSPYQYLSPGVKGEVDIFSLGADGQPGGAGNDADIGSWDL